MSGVSKLCRAVFAGLTIVVCTAALGDCQGQDAPNSPEHLITGFAGSPNVAETFHELNEAARENTAALRRAALAHLADKDPEIHYAALYALAMTADAANGSSELAAMLDSPSVDDRLLSAGALAGLGNKRALPVLIGALDQPEPMRYRVSMERACDFAKQELLWFTRQDFGLKSASTNEQIAATKPAWQRWWQEAGASVHFDRQVSRFVE
jgi:hypothetical protein